MNTHAIDTNPLDLTLELRSMDGTSTQFYQAGEENVRTTLRLLATPRLFTQPELILGSEHNVSMIMTRTIDVILARTAAPLPDLLPLNSPAGPVDILEVVNDLACDDSFTTLGEGDADGPAGMNSRTFRVEIHTIGGWKSLLAVRARVRGTVQDRRQTFAHMFHVPLIPFYLEAGGIGFINPANISRATAYPPPDSLPENALSMDLLRSTPLIQ